MRIPFGTICVAVAVCRVGGCVRAEPFGVATKLSCLLSAGGSEVATERHLRSQETVQAGEERVEPGTAAVESAVNALKQFGPEYIDEWVTAKQSTADVVKLLALDKAETVLRHPENLAVLGNFVKQLKLADPKSKDSLIKALTIQYGDKGVFKIIEAGKQAPETARLAKRLQGEQFQYWLSVHRRPKDVFAIMELDKAEDKLFEMPEIFSFVKYVDQFKEVYPRKPVSSKKLYSYIKNRNLVRMLIAAQKIPSTEKLAVRLQASCVRNLR